MSTPPHLHQSLRLLIRANHILHYHGLVDAFGHVSIRHPLNFNHYIIAGYDPGAPALVSSKNHFITYHVSDSTPVDPNAAQGYSERYIHGEIFCQFPEATCVVHSHSEVVIPFTLGNEDVRPVFHMAGFLGHEPVKVFGNPRGGEGLDMLVKSQTIGARLAGLFSLERPVVLQHKHGFTTFGRSVEEAIYRAIYMQSNCRLLAQAIGFVGEKREVGYLTKEEAAACKVMNEKCQDKSFRLWLREVQVNPLYVNEEGEPEKGEVAGMRV